MYYPSTYPKKYDQLLKDLFLFLIKKNPRDRKKLMSLIRSFITEKKENFFPKLWQLYFVYLRYFKKDVEVDENFLDLLKVVKIRSLSGIVPLSVFTSPKNSCPYNCVYCALNPDAPKSYFSDEAAVQRAKRNDYHPFFQVQDRLIQFYLSGHPIDKVELIIQGGTFSFYDKKYREWFVKRVFDSLNTDFEKLIIEGKTEFKSAKNLDEAKKENEKAKSRMVGLTIETRPDWINEDEVLFLRYLGVTRVELGVQSVNNEILRIVRRGHTIDKVFQATKLLYVLKNESFFIKDLEGCALIRELHVLGVATPLSKKGKVQHQGLGKKLIFEAIKIAKKFNLSKIAVISAVGTRDYYRNLGFKKITKEEYLVKNIS